MKLPRLTPRLQKIYDIAQSCTVAADIGTDHAYIPVHLCKSGKCLRAIASDVGKGPLKRAEETAREYGCENISLRLGSGLSTLSENEAEVIIIAGMGGILISNILDASQKTAHSAKQLILQPMTAAPELREYLNRSGYTIKKEYLAEEEDKIYTIIEVLPKADTPYTPAELYMGKALDRGGLYDRYRAERIKKLDKRIKGLSLSEKEENKRALLSLINLKEMIENENL